MLFKEILGLNHIKKHLSSSADAGRIPSAQLFVGAEGSGTLPMAIAYAQYIICSNKNAENDGVNSACNLKFDQLSHPDMHFVYPTANSDKIKSHAVSDHYITDWITFVKEQPYGNLFDWYRAIGIEKKQAQIGVDEAAAISKKLSLKPYEGGYRVMLIWMAEKINSAASNKLLKLIEEPPAKTIFILITEDEEQIIQTIKSRCQILHFPPLAEQTIAEGLIKKGLTKEQALRFAHEANGNFNKALDLMNNDSEDLVFEKWFVYWVRTAFKAKGNKEAIIDLLSWSEEVAKNGRETQKKFLQYCLVVIRQAMLINFGAPSLAYLRFHTEKFDLRKFAPFIHENNVLPIIEIIEESMYHVERNGNSKIIFADLSIKLTRLIHQKKSAFQNKEKTT